MQCSALSGRAQAIRLLLTDEQQLDREREVFKAKRKQYQGFSREQLSSQGSGRMGADHGQLPMRRTVRLSWHGSNLHI
jgi:hypothetical protein